MQTRIEALLFIANGIYICEKLGNPAYPANLGKIRCPGGRQEAGEEPEDTIVRELREEYGIQIDRNAVGQEIALPGAGNVRRFKVAAPDGLEGLASLDDIGTVLVAVTEDHITAAWSYDETLAEATIGVQVSPPAVEAEAVRTVDNTTAAIEQTFCETPVAPMPVAQSTKLYFGMHRDWCVAAAAVIGLAMSVTIGGAVAGVTTTTVVEEPTPELAPSVPKTSKGGWSSSGY
jgi:8-oxo-dGTP pyrophosphatase MutT (NUDIX family)